ncbi:MAG: hypothetical protein AAFR04_15560 [Pseudomonadota bacterium]
MSILIIDDQGELWDGNSRQLRRSFDSPFSGGEFTTYAVKNLGFLSLHRYQRSVEVRIRPHIVTDRALRGLKDWLVKHPVDRVVVTWFDRTWHHHMVGRAADALRWLERSVGIARAAKESAFLTRPVDPLDIDPQTPFATLMRDWEPLVRANGQHELFNTLKAVFNNRYVLMGQRPGERHLSFMDLGEGLYSFLEGWSQYAIGRPVEDQPDQAYGSWVSDTYGTTINDKRPRFDDVDAIVTWPIVGRTRIRYRRAIFPLQPSAQGEGGPLLLGASVLDTSVDLRKASA